MYNGGEGKNQISDFIKHSNPKIKKKFEFILRLIADENNQLKGTVWPGKSDLYHAVQATLIPYYAANLSIAVAVKEEEKC